MAVQTAAQNEIDPIAKSPNLDEVELLLGRSTSDKTSKGKPILWLVVVSMVVFFVPLYLFSVSVTEDAKGISTDLGFMKTSLTQVPSPAPAIQRWLTPLAQAQGQLSQVNAVMPTLSAFRPDWPAIMTAMGNYDPNQLTLTSITRTTTSLTITGRANDDTAITTFAHTLEQSGLFSRVTIQSIHAIATTPTVTATKSSASSGVSTAMPQPSPISTKPASASQPPAAVYAVPGQAPPPPPTATPDLGDTYEPDASQPQPIAIGQSQTHNFYPDGDIDMVSFLAKAGHYYHVYTSNLAAGVDTVIAVRIGGVVMQNDDAYSGSLYSDLVIQNTGVDTNATITISNRGTYGAGETYDITVEEISATATPPPTATPSPTPTRTNTPTVTPTWTPTATPDLRDPYEPDDTNATAKAIYIGSTQSHNFYPSGDIDKVTFPVKSGRFYQALTSSLALGVDTVVTVTVDNLQWVNDDYTSGNNNFASSVCFSVLNDGSAVATIANKALQYGLDKTYKISVSEIPTLTVSSCFPITPVPAVSYQSKTVPGYAAPIRSGIDLFDPASRQSINAPTLEFVIIADLKVTSP